MKKTKKFLRVLTVLVFLTMLLVNSIVLASETIKLVRPMEFTEEYKEYLKLSDEEKEKVFEPRAFEIIRPSTTKNPFKLARAIESSTVSKYTLKSAIPENLKIRNQGQTGTCWAFATLSSLETNLAVKDYKNKASTKKIYDFSERHMDYALAREFVNNEINPYGVNRKPGTGATFDNATAYLTNGMGAIDEASMEFKNNSDLIDISEIQNKKVTTEVFDTVDFPSYDITEDTTEIKGKIKEHIKNYGSVGASIHGAQIFSDYYNNDTRSNIL